MELHEPIFKGNELKYIKKCFKDNLITFGTFINKFENAIKKYLKIKYAVSVINGTAALHIALKLLGANSNTEVICPSITFIAPVNSIIYNNASPIFMDVDEKLNIDQEKTINFIKKKTFFKNNFTYNKKTKKKIVCIIIVHVFGNAANISKLVAFCKKRNIKIIEDASESLGTKYLKSNLKNKFTGTIGEINAISFNGNKIITSGGGGIILTNSFKHYKKARYLINQAKDNSINYIHNDIGYNYRLSNLQAAIGLAQLEKINFFLKKKREINQIYKKKINKINGLSILSGPNYANNNNWLNILVIDTKNYKDNAYKLVKKLISKGINVRNIWHPNHLQKKFISFERHNINKSLEYCSRMLCLPSSNNITRKEIVKIANILNGK